MKDGGIPTFLCRYGNTAAENRSERTQAGGGRGRRGVEAKGRDGGGGEGDTG